MTLAVRPIGEPWPFGDSKPLTYDVICADPPWLFKLRSAAGEYKSPQRHYKCMTVDEICALPVHELGRGDCLLMLWSTWPMVATGEHVRVMKAWGFRPVTGGSWTKRTVNGKAAFGGGYVVRSASEPFFFGTMGSPQYANNLRGLIEAEGMTEIDAVRREHSRKPDEQYDYLERLVPRGARFLELFSRATRPGWDSWGDEAGKFDAP